jgi:hypothetical protein
MNPIGDPTADRRAQMERLRLEAEGARAKALLDQRDQNATPEARVRTWERLHQLRLPRDPSHAVLPHVAEQTGLELAEVQEVQRQRARPR